MQKAWPLLLFAIALPAHACWQDAAARYGVDARLLYAIAQQESSLNAPRDQPQPCRAHGVGGYRPDADQFALVAGLRPTRHSRN